MHRWISPPTLAIASLVCGCSSIIEYGGPDGGGPGQVVIPAGPWINATSNLAGMPSECGNLTSLSVRPDRDSLIAGIAQRGLWVSNDGSTSFTQLGQSSGSAVIVNRPTALVFDPDQLGTFYESGIYNGAAVYKTSDQGATFAPVGSTTHCDLVSIDFSDPARRTLLAGGHESGQRLLYSTDSGQNWTDIGKQFPATAGNTTFPLIIDAQTYLVGTWSGSAAGVYRSTDAGRSWNQVSTAGVNSRPLRAIDGAIYWMVEGDRGVIKSDDKGKSWTSVAGPGVVATTEAGLVELPDGRLVAPGLGSSTLMISKDKGANWQKLGPPLPYPPTGVVYSKYRKAFYLWRFDCLSGPDPVPADAIMSSQFDYQAP